MTSIFTTTRAHQRTRGAWVLSVLLCANCVAQAQQTCNANLPRTRPDARYEEVAGATPPGSEVRDKVTGLIWQRCLWGYTYTKASNTCTGTDTPLTWQAAMQAARTATPSTTTASPTPWRVPTHAELFGLVERLCGNPAINLAVFPNTPAHWMWSSSTYPDKSSAARTIAFAEGWDLWPADGYSLKSNAWRLRLVRSGP